MATKYTLTGNDSNLSHWDSRVTSASVSPHSGVTLLRDFVYRQHSEAMVRWDCIPQFPLNSRRNWAQSETLCRDHPRAREQSKLSTQVGYCTAGLSPCLEPR